MVETLSSEKNPLLKDVRKAVSRGSLTEGGFAVAEGFHLLDEAMKSQCEISAVIVSESAASRVDGMKAARVISVPDTIFDGLASTETTQGVIALVRPPAWTLDQVLRGKSLVVILDGVQDPGNAGAIVRAAEAFGATGAVFLKGSVSPYNPKAMRASAGSVFRLPMTASADENLFLAALDQKRIALYAAMPRVGDAPANVDLTARTAIVIGGEGGGVTPRIAEKAIGLRIPTCGVESLNAAVAAGVLLYEARRQRTAA
jgi:TrmH family RNA methyltransferase